MISKSKKSSATPSKLLLQSANTLKKKRMPYGSNQDGMLSTPSIESTFPFQFKMFCEKFGAWKLPEVNIVPCEPDPGSFPELPSSEASMGTRLELKIKKQEEEEAILKPSRILFAIFNDYETQTQLNTVIAKQFVVDRSMLIALRKSFQTFNMIAILKLEQCGLKNTDLRTLKTILQQSETITELSINGNPNKFQNFYILLKNTFLSKISMSSCQINDRGIDLIARQLIFSSNQTLIWMNLSSNFISDEGILFLANALRINRTLLSLNVADNSLTDTGCSALMKILNVFTLNHDEIVIRRHRIMSYLLRRMELVELYKRKLFEAASSELSTTSSQRKSSKSSSIKSSKRNSKETAILHKLKKRHRKDNSFIDSKEVTDEELIKETILAKMEPDDHPFVRDTYSENKEIYCKGNLKLMHLNLSYNKITTAGVEEIINTIRCQHTQISPLFHGLLYVALEGNHLPENSIEFEEIKELLKESHAMRFSSALSKNKTSKQRGSGSAKNPTLKSI